MSGWTWEWERQTGFFPSCSGMSALCLHPEDREWSLSVSRMTGADVPDHQHPLPEATTRGKKASTLKRLSSVGSFDRFSLWVGLIESIEREIQQEDSYGE
jgi:hypothetical protein